MIGPELARDRRRSRVVPAFGKKPAIKKPAINETRYPGYYYHTRFLDLNDEEWKRFISSTYDRDIGQGGSKAVPWTQLLKD